MAILPSSSFGQTRPRTSTGQAGGRQTAFDPVSLYQGDTKTAAEAPAGRDQAQITTPGFPNPYLPSGQRGTPAQDAFANQGNWTRLDQESNYRAAKPETGGNYSEATPAQPGLFNAPQRDRVGTQPERMFRDFSPQTPGQGGPPGPGQRPEAAASPFENSPAFRGANTLRFLGNPLQANRTDIPLTENLAGTRQPGRFPMMPSKQRQVGINRTVGAAPLPTSYPTARKPKVWSVRGSVP
jgi:hypothetical protein